MNFRRGTLASFGLAGCLVLAGTCWVSGQQDRLHGGYRPQQDLHGGMHAGTTYEHSDQTSPALVLGQRSTSLVGSCVKMSDGHVIGRVEDLMINADGCVDYMIVSFNGSSEFGGRLAAIPWNVGRMDFGTRIVTLDVERDFLREAPIFFSRGRGWPNLYEPQWAASVHSYFGVESDIDRRIERAHARPDAEFDAGMEGDLDTGRDFERQGDLPEPRDLEQRRQIRNPRDRHLAPMPDAEINSDSEINRNELRSETSVNTENPNRNNDDEFSQQKPASETKASDQEGSDKQEGSSQPEKSQETEKSQEESDQG